MINCRILVFVLIASCIVSADVGTLNLNVIVEDIDPNVVEPGNDFTVTLQLQNNGDKSISDVEVTPRVEGPIVLKTKDTTDIEKSICIGCSKQVTFYFRASSTAVSGNYPVVFQITAADQLSIKKTANIKITGKPDIIFFYESDASSIAPKEGFVAKLKFKNIGTGTANNIRITSTTDNFVLAGSNTILIDEIDVNQERSVDLEFYVSETITPDSYFIPLQIEYEDNLLNSYTETQNIGIEIMNIAELGVQKLKFEPAILRSGMEALAYLVVENNGKGDAKNTEVVFSVDGEEQKAYLGNIKSEEDEQIAFTFIPRGFGDKNVEVAISYKDDGGSHTLRDELSVNVRSGFKLALVLFWIVLAVAGIAIGAYLVRKKGY